MLEFKLPEIGEGVVEGEIVRWHKQPGEHVQANEALVEVMTDKATIEVPSPVAGTLRELVAQVGDICAVEQVIAIIDLGAPGEAPRPAAGAVAAPAPAAQVSGGSVLATPAARALARESGIDLQGLPVDERGRITKNDVMRAQQVASASAELYAGTGPKSQVPAARPAPVAAAAPVYTAPAGAPKPAPRPRSLRPRPRSLRPRRCRTRPRRCRATRRSRFVGCGGGSPRAWCARTRPPCTTPTSSRST
jgi:pyruvate/2-oxoglutarate dehydrogenase complex dihydrolipoamide acyltransferase (E2) component